jgi:RimJ/RimL family protein N-acetyltransferase
MSESAAAGAERIEAFGIVLRRMAAGDIEMVRQWRNSPAVAQFMASREPISAQQQQRWFEGMDSARQFFYVVEVGGRPVGLVQLKDVDPVARTAEGGIYIADERFRDGFIGLAAIIAMYDHGFTALGLETITAQILPRNERAIRFNRALGFRKQPQTGPGPNEPYLLSRADYWRCTEKLRAFLASR